MHNQRNGNVLAALNHGHFGVKVQRSTDGAETWQECLPRSIHDAEGYIPKPIPFFNKPLDWALKLIWGMAPGRGDTGRGIVWCRTMPGGILKIRRTQYGET